MDKTRIDVLVCRSMLAGAWLLLMVALPCIAQDATSQGQATNGGAPPQHAARIRPADLDQLFPADLDNPAQQEMRLRQLSVAQHKAMVADTEKLVKMAAELNAEIGNANPASYKPEQLRKLSEIEKLARSIKDRMRISLQGISAFPDATPPPPPARH